MTRFIQLSAILLAFSPAFALEAKEKKIHVLVWDEQQPRQKPTYPNFLGEKIAEELRKNPSLDVRTARLDGPEKGLKKEDVEWSHVIVWWGHVRQHQVPVEKAKWIVDRVKKGEVALLTLHSAHWSLPFMIAMEEKAAQDALARLPDELRAKAKVVFEGKRKRKVPPRKQRNFLKTRYSKDDKGNVIVKMQRPHCVFPKCCDPVEPSKTRILIPDHPIARGLPREFTLPETEMYDEPFGIPEPDLVVMEEFWEGGEHFRSGALWNVGKGQVFYFRPGHETYKVFYEKPAIKVVDNACVYLGDDVLSRRDR
ncbi:MAG: ThuA domain-containing protein [Planctomycetota bacterium]